MGGDSLNPNISYVREDGKVYATGDVSEDFSGAVVYARYNITDDMSKTGLFSTSNVKSLKVDGEVMEFEPEVEMSGELTVLGENISFDMENETYYVPEEYLFDNSKLSSLVVRPSGGNVSDYNAVCLSISMGGMNYPMPLMFEEAAEMGIVINYDNNLIDLSPMLELLSMYYPGNSSVCMLSVDENYETLVFGDTLVCFSGIFGSMPAVFDFESAGEHELEVLLKDVESIGGMFTNNFEVDYGLVEVVIPDTVKYLDEYCFAYDNNLAKVTIPESVESIGNNCFTHCPSLTDVIFLGEGVKSIGSYAFGYCENLTAISLPDSIEILEYSAFYECRSLNSVKLPNGISALNSYTFYNCVALENVVIPDSVTNIYWQCFCGCSSLTSINIQENVTSIEELTFSGCSSLTSVIIESQAIASMTELRIKFGEQVTTYILGDGVTSIGNGTFSSCTGLTYINLPDGLESIGRHAFSSCSGLTSINLPDGLKTIDDYAFSSCPNLSTITLPARLTNVGLYAFQNCVNLKEIHALPSTPPTQTRAFLGVPSNGVLYHPYGSDYSSWKNDDLADWEFVPDFTATECTSLSITANNVMWDETTTTICYTATVNGVDSLGNIITGVVITGTTGSEEFEKNHTYETIERVVTFEFMGVTATTTISQIKNYLRFVALEDGTFSFNLNSTSDDIQYSKDNGDTWISLSSGETVSVVEGDNVMWKSTNTPNANEGVGRFSSTGRFEAYGNVMSLLFGDRYAERTSFLGLTYAFYGLFSGCTNLTKAPELPATTLDLGCYQNMFECCTSLTTAPKLPATTLANQCYCSMFQGCTSLTTAPELPATTFGYSCYSHMFDGCTSLTTAPELPATTMAANCYAAMFMGCTSLTTAPELPATTLASHCYYNMFAGCTSLTTAPELPAMTLADYCYYQMFSGCTSLTTAPELPATTMAVYCCGNMFQGCTSLTTAPSILPATTLAKACYSSMFSKCTSLTTTPELPATTLADSCYGIIFSGCTKLSKITMLATDISASNCLKYWVSGVASTGTFVKHPDMDSLPTGTSGIPNSWTVEDYQG